MSTFGVAVFKIDLRLCEEKVREIFLEYQISTFEAPSSEAVPTWIVEHDGLVQLLDFDTCAYRLYSMLSQQLNSGRLVITFDDQIGWSYELYDSSKKLALFSTRPALLDGEDAEVGRNLHLVASMFDVPIGRLSRYCENWSDDDNLSPKAYPVEDEFEVGDMWQGWDFLRAVGGVPIDLDSKPAIWHEHSGTDSF